MVQRAPVGDGHQQQVEQHAVRPAGQRQMQVGQIAGRGAARVDHHHFQPRAGGLGGGQALIKDRMAPGEVRSDQYHQIGTFKILIKTRNGIRAEGPAVSRHRRRHAKS